MFEKDEPFSKYGKWTIKQLVAELRKRKAKVTGKKSELVNGLLTGTLTELTFCLVSFFETIKVMFNFV